MGASFHLPTGKSVGCRTEISNRRLPVDPPFSIRILSPTPLSLRGQVRLHGSYQRQQYDASFFQIVKKRILGNLFDNDGKVLMANDSPPPPPPTISFQFDETIPYYQLYDIVCICMCTGVEQPKTKYELTFSLGSRPGSFHSFLFLFLNDVKADIHPPTLTSL